MKIFPVSKNARFTHDMTKFRPMVSGKRFSTHETWKTRRSIMQRNQNPHDAEHPKTLNSPPLSRKNCFLYHLKRFPCTKRLHKHIRCRLKRFFGTKRLHKHIWCRLKTFSRNKTPLKALSVSPKTFSRYKMNHGKLIQKMNPTK